MKKFQKAIVATFCVILLIGVGLTGVSLCRKSYTLAEVNQFLEVSVVPSALHRHLHWQLHSGHIGGIYDRYAIRLPYEPISRCEPAASWPG